MVSHIRKPETCSNLFLAPEIERDEEKIPMKAPKSMSFFRKFAELQLLMLQHNAGLTASHPYASSPINWPFVISGISFWTENDSKKQIYLVGNVVGWWACTVALSIFVGILGADLLARRRGMDPISDRKNVRTTLAITILILLCQLSAIASGITLDSSSSSGLFITFRSSSFRDSFLFITTCHLI